MYSLCHKRKEITRCFKRNSSRDKVNFTEEISE